MPEFELSLKRKTLFWINYEDNKRDVSQMWLEILLALT